MHGVRPADIVEVRLALSWKTSSVDTERFGVFAKQLWQSAAERGGRDRSFRPSRLQEIEDLKFRSRRGVTHALGCVACG